MLSKIYRASGGPETHYSPAVCIGCETKVISRTPDPKHVSISYVERQNLRCGCRLTIAAWFSSFFENAFVYFMHYDFGCVPQTLRVAPAMEAGIADHVWSIEEIVGCLNSEGRMRLSPRRILLHIIIVLAVIAVPLLMPSSCGRSLLSEVEGVLTAGISN
jgi:hypothetical protein